MSVTNPASARTNEIIMFTNVPVGTSPNGSATARDERALFLLIKTKPNSKNSN